VHAKQSDYLLPNTSLKNIKSWKRDALISYASAQHIALPENTTITKDVLIKHITAFLKERVLEKISAVSANEMTLIQMGIKMVQEFDKVLCNPMLGKLMLGKLILSNTDILDSNPILSSIDHIVIENQISPIANRMKTLQGMIAQYFIMRGKETISFISSANKLKLFSKDKVDIKEKDNVDIKDKDKVDVKDNVDVKDKDKVDVKDKDKVDVKDKGKSSYSERKKESVNVVKDLLDEHIINYTIINESIINCTIINESIINEPIINEPIINEHIINEPIINEPIINEPIINEPTTVNWKTHFLTHKKKDDLADAFLQGVWFLSKT
jgi:hypothetical protein